MTAPDHTLRRSEDPCIEGGIQTYRPIHTQCFPRVPYRVPSPTLRIGVIGRVFSSQLWVRGATIGGAVTAPAIAQMKPTISRAMAVMTTTFALPAATRWR